MIDLRALGALDLRQRDGPELHSVLAQPKRTALLLYLALARPHGFHRRDSLIALFWPEHDTEHARASLRQSIHFLRRSMGERAIVSRGDDDLGLGDGVLCCDAVQFEAALEASQPERALALYKGDLLPGFFVEEAPDFESWLEGERTRLRDRAVRACWSLAEACEAAADTATAAEWGRRALEIAPSEDSQIMRLMQLLARSGDRSGALAAFEAHARRLRTELEVEPTGTAKALADEIRKAEPKTPDRPSLLARVTPAAASPDAASPPTSERATAGAAPAEAGAERLPTPDTSGSPPLPPRAAEADSEPAPAPLGRRLPTRRLIAATSILAVLLVASWYTLERRGHGRVVDMTSRSQRVAVMYFEDAAPGEIDRGLAATLTETVIDQFRDSPGLTVISAPGVAPYRGKHVRPDSIARALDVGLLVSGTIMRVTGRIRVRIALLDARTAEELDSQIIERPARELDPLVDDVAREAAVFLRRRIGEVVQLTSRPDKISDAAWRLYQRGRQAEADGSILLKAGEQAAAVAGFRRADSLLAQAEHAAPEWNRPTVVRAWTQERIAFALWLPNQAGSDSAGSRRALERGMADATRALRRDPGDGAALEVLAVLKHRLWQYWGRFGSRSSQLMAAAESAALNAVTADRHLARAWSVLGDIRYRNLDYAGAQNAAAHAYAEDAYAADAGDNLWRAYNSAFQLQEDDLAGRWCNELRRRNRSQGIAARCALQLAAWGEPMPDLAAARQARAEFGGADAPQDDADWRLLVDLDMAAVLARVGERDSAEALIARTTTQQQPLVRLRSLAAVRILLHQEDAAIRLLREYLASVPEQRRAIALGRQYIPLRGRPDFTALTQPPRTALDR